MDANRKIFIAIGLTAFFLTVGTFGYVRIEDFSLLDAFYMTVITISTVGFGEINQLTGDGRVFTIFLILSGVGSLAFAAHAFTESLIERAANPQSRKRVMLKKIEKLRGHYIICGHGRVGAAAASHFQKAGADFVIIEASENMKKFLEEEGYLVIFGDATSQKSLLAAGIKKADALLALLDSDPENLFAVLTARELNPTLRIIARTEIASTESKILRAGADSVISPYASAGKRVADKIIEATRKETSQAQGEFQSINPDQWLGVTADSELASHSVGVAERLLQAKIVGVRRDDNDKILPEEDFVIRVGDKLLITSIKRDSLSEKPKQIEQKKIVLIDDNPVVRQLYTRLFQKAGYNIITAENGEEGLAVIRKESPDAAVIDYMLPDISGLEVCRQLRSDTNADTIRLVLFTADEQEDTRKKALEAGVETVVVKSPEASEIIAKIEQSLG